MTLGWTIIGGKRIMVDLREQARSLSLRDPLTDLPNRRAMLEWLGQHMQRNSRVGLVLADLDGFKDVNTLYGYPAGDAVLCRTARMLESCVRSGDMVARLGGDEFAVLTLRADKEGLEALCRRLLEAVRTMPRDDVERVSLTVSLGWALYPEDAGTIDELVASADLCVRSVKLAGKAGCCPRSSTRSTPRILPGRAPAARPPRLLSRRSRPRRRGLARDARAGRCGRAAGDAAAGPARPGGRLREARRARAGLCRGGRGRPRRGLRLGQRLAGGRAAVFREGTLELAHAVPEPDPRPGIHDRFEAEASLIAEALQSLGVDARVGEVPGEYCPGRWSVNAGGTRKLAGIGQRVIHGGAHVGTVVVVEDAESIRPRAGAGLRGTRARVGPGHGGSGGTPVASGPRRAAGGLCDALRARPVVARPRNAGLGQGVETSAINGGPIEWWALVSSI